MNQEIKTNDILPNVVFKTKNIIIQKIKEGSDKKCLLIGKGNSLSVNENNEIVSHDPGMKTFEVDFDTDATVYTFYFTFECAGLTISSEEITNFVNNLSDSFNQIYLIGHSKCGPCLYKTTELCNRKVNLITISSPFKGTKVADKSMMEKELKYKLLINFYNKIFSNHNVDKDIAPNSEFIKNFTFSKLENHINITASLDHLTSCEDLIDLFLYFFNKVMKINGDGIVPLESQELNNVETYHISGSHDKALKLGINKIKNLK